MEKIKLFKRKSTSEIIVFSIAFCVILLHCLIILYIYLYGVNASFRESNSAFMRDPNKLAVELNFRNYLKAFSIFKIGTTNFFGLIWNTIWQTALGTFISLGTATCSTYCVAKYKCKFTKFIFNLVLFIMVFPVYGSGVASYKLYHALGMVNTPFLFLTGLNNMCHLMIYAFFVSIPWTYAEAAMIDGAGHFKIFYKIMLPMVWPSLCVLLVSSIMGGWNDYMTSMVYMTEYPTLAYGLYVYEELSKYNANKPVYFAGVVISMIPPMILYYGMQNTIMEKVHFGGLKG